MVSLPRPAKGARNSRVVLKDSEGLWDRPALMDLIADFFFAVGGLLLLWSVMIWLQQLPAFSLRHLVLVDATSKVSSQQIDYVAKTTIAGNFFTVDLAAARAAFQSLPWVRKAELRRVWPDTLELTLEEHQAAARWTPHDGEQRLVNTYGEVFVADLDESGEAAALPEFVGPENSAQRVLVRFHEISSALRPIARMPTNLVLSSREAWRAELDDGLTLELGRDQAKQNIADRLARFTAAYPIVQAKIQALTKVVDMRYPNGFAVRPRGKA